MSRELVLATLAFCCLSPNLAAAPAYTITSVYELPQGHQALSVGGINDLGAVVGDDTIIGSQGAVWLYNSGQITFPGFPRFASGINNQGQIVGTITGGILIEDAAIAGNGAGVIIPRLFQPQNESQVRPATGNAINNAGDAVGMTPALPDFMEHAFLYTQGAVVDLGVLNGNFSAAHGINDSKQVVGFVSFDANGTPYTHAFLYSAGVMSDFGTLGGNNSIARGINNKGQVVGDSDLGGGGTHAFLYDQGVMMDLGSLGGNSQANAINNAGQIVGSSNGHPFVFMNSTMSDLNDLIPPSSGWVLTSATGINSSGQIIGLGMHNGVLSAYLATPVPTVGPPSCQVSQIVTGPPKQLIVAIEDTGSGLASIDVLNSVNAFVSLPAFSRGATSQLLVTATKIDQTQSSDVGFLVTNMAGLTTSCDPVDFTATLDGFTEQHVFRSVSPAEHYIRITNGTPGVRQMTFLVNGHSFPVRALPDGDTYSLDIGSALLPTTPASIPRAETSGRSAPQRVPRQTANNVVMYASGQRGASAYILIGDSSVLSSSTTQTPQ